MSTVMELVGEAKQQIRNLTPAEVSAAIDAGDVTLVDLREADEVGRTGTIPGAVRAPRGMLEFHADPSSPYHLPELDPARPTILYCASGGRSALAAVSLKRLGYGDVAHLDGGVKAWQEQGHELVAS